MSPVISVEHLSKTYRLGLIGTGTFSRDLEGWWAKMRGKPNPMLKIGQTDHGNRDGEDLWALQEVSFEVQQGEVLGMRLHEIDRKLRKIVDFSGVEKLIDTPVKRYPSVSLRISSSGKGYA